LNTVKTGTPAPDSHSAQGEAHHAESLPPLAVPVLVALCAIKLLVHLFTSVCHYGYFRDELYYLDMARHLDWGYVDAAPLIAVYTKVAMLMGGSLAALRILPALAGAALVALTILITRELGGGRYAQLLAGIIILLCPAVLVMGSLLTMNAFESLYWMGCIWVVARILRTEDSRLWLWFGVFAGLGLENKHSTLSFGFAVVVALLLTQYRREFARPWIWLAGAIALALFLPNIIWQIRHHFPTIEDLANVRREGKNVILGPLAFVKEQIIDMHPILLPVWLAGLVSPRPPLARPRPDVRRLFRFDGGRPRQELLCLPDVPDDLRGRRCSSRKMAGKPGSMDTGDRYRRHRTRRAPRHSDGDVDATAGTSPCLSKRYWFQTLQGRGAP
jgi:hypothetical protein